MMKSVRLAFSLALPVVVGMVSAAISSKGMSSYATMNKPPLSPPAWVFSVVWTILYLLMGLAFYLVWVEELNSSDKLFPMILFVIQLAMNFFWSIIFFNLEMYLFAFIWLIAMWCIVIVCTLRFLFINKLAGCLLIPYVLWLSFAGYLNVGAFILKANNVS